MYKKCVSNKKTENCHLWTCYVGDFLYFNILLSFYLISKTVTLCFHHTVKCGPLKATIAIQPLASMKSLSTCLCHFELIMWRNLRINALSRQTWYCKKSISDFQKSTKNAMETGRTFGTLFVDLEFKHLLLDVKADWEFKALLSEHAKKLAKEQGNPDCRNSHLQLTAFDDLEGDVSTSCGVVKLLPLLSCQFVNGLFKKEMKKDI